MPDRPSSPDDQPTEGVGGLPDGMRVPPRPPLPAQPPQHAQPVSRREARERAQAAASAATLDDLFTKERTVIPDKAERRRNRRIGGWIFFAFTVIVLGAVVGGGLYVWNTYESQIRAFMGWEEPKDYEDGLATGEALVTITSGDVPSDISRSLFDAKVTKTPEAFYAMLIETGQNPTFYPGVYRLQQQMTSVAALEALENPENKLENSALVREGLTVDRILPLLAEGLALPIEDFQAAVADPSRYGVAADSLEGWLFPAMYTFDPDVTAGDVIQAMVNRTVTALDDAGVSVDQRNEILTIASIIEREGRTDDFDKVSRVIQNRLSPDNQETFGKLEMDSTAQYGFNEMHDGTASSSAQALADDNPWNTYVHPGLPIGPIANAGEAAINAALHPADGPWYYFVTWNMDTGETIFSTTYAEHQAGISKWHEWCAANDNRGC